MDTSKGLIIWSSGCIIIGACIIVLGVKNPREWGNHFPYYHRTQLIFSGIFSVIIGIIILYDIL